MRLTKAIVALTTLLCVGFANAADIEWDDVIQVTGAEVIISEGPLVHAVTTTTSGVEQTVGDVTFTPVDGLLASTTGDASFGGVVDGGAFDIVLNSHTWQGGGGSFEIDSLTPGEPYAVQIFGVYDTRDCCAERETVFSDGRGLDAASGGVFRGQGQAVTGFFTADAETQTIEVFGGVGGDGVDPGLSAYVVRQVPEPSGIGLAMFGLLGLLKLRRR